MDASNDGSESVDQFLARIASLNSKQGLEEAERSRKMEEEMLQARRERQARRAERARSLSPSKTGPSPSLRRVEDSPKRSQGIEPPVALTPPLQSRTLGRSGSISPTPRRPAVSDLDFSRPLPPAPLNEKPSVPSPLPNATALSRSGTLSWNQRPSSRAGGSMRSRPQSLASIPDTSATFGTGSPKTTEEISRKDTAASLGTKDPSWFRQTSDRGAGSLAYRRGEAEAETDTFQSGSMKLPGLSKDRTLAHERERTGADTATPPTSPLKSTPSSIPDQKRSSIVESRGRPRPVSLVSETPSKSPLLDLPTFKPLDLNSSFEADVSGLGRTSSILSSAGRSPSPTKGLGGFVQSAMMKRSDSVSKRWSVQASAGLKRGDSIAASRPPHLPGQADYSPGHSRNSSKDTRPIREGYSSPLTGSRPVSSHGPEPVPFIRGRATQQHEESGPSPRAQTNVERRDHSEPMDSGIKPQNVRNETPPPPESPLARSPSKTMDPRRWSPTKASWLESALNKPDSPRFTPAKVETPAWKLNMQRTKIEEESRSSASAAVGSGKPLLASKSTSSLSLGSSQPPEAETSDLGFTKLVPEKAPLQKAGPKAAVAEATVSTPLMNSSGPKKEDKPLVPPKRNLTPVHKPAAEEATATSQVNATEPLEKSQISADHGSKSEAKPPTVKPKPQTPPKIDFRANLKPRQAPSTSSNDTEPEFKAVFGKLKRTQTQHYVAPDVLKDNIIKGKSALNATEGPQKTKHVDDFKESILQKKEAMKTGAASTSRRPESPEFKTKPAESVPEALARRMTLHKRNPSSEKVETKKTFGNQTKSGTFTPVPDLRTEKLASLGSDSPLQSERTVTPGKASQSADIKKSHSIPVKPEIIPQKTEIRPASDLVAKEPKKEPMPEPATEPESKTKVPEKSKIAARLNPALAGLLSRTGGPRQPGDPLPTESVQGKVRENQRAPSPDGGTESAELTHMTKARARGPKRRAPKAGASKETPSKETIVAAVEKPEVRSGTPRATVRSFPEPSSAAPGNQLLRSLRGGATWPVSDTKKEESTRKDPGLPDLRSSPSPAISRPQAQQLKPVAVPGVGSSTKSDDLHESDSSIKAKPPVANKSSELRRVSNTLGAPKPSDKTTPAKPSTPKKFDVLVDRTTSVSSPPESDGEKKAASKTPPLSSALPLTPSKSKLNTPKPVKPSFDISTKSASTTTSSKASGLGLKFDSPSKKPATMPELTPPPERDVAAARVAVSPTKASSTLRPQIDSFFGVLPRASERAEFDTQSFLSSQHHVAEKKKTLSNQIWEVTGDGKRTAMPPQQEHILFEECMYLCVHSMQSLNGTKLVEVYLWCGDEVPAAAIEDAQLFCRKVVRDNSTKLQVVRQGKESSEFFQALGGIVIVRRNKSSALYMLCGRRHLGHLAFDEVDLSHSSLCSGLPFLISAKFGKLYLWKGAGSDPEDVGCARLIGMDLGLTGEIEEISEGEEPASFWESFPSQTPRRIAAEAPKAAGHLRGRSPRLYRVEHDRPKSSAGFWGLRPASPPKQPTKAIIEEIAPFTQKDLDANHIHILDTYDEIYVLVGVSAKRPAEFVTAVQVAQEMAVLAPSVQDRPVLPSCFVVMGEPPQHVRRVFRKWTPQRANASSGQLCVKVEEVMLELGMTL